MVTGGFFLLEGNRLIGGIQRRKCDNVADGGNWWSDVTEQTGMESTQGFHRVYY